MSGEAELADLLADVTWLRELAQRLAGRADGDDLAQDAVLGALGKERPPGAGLRPWLVVTARNLWRRRRRDESRRRAHQAALEAPELAVSADEALVRLDTLALVARLVRELPDPYRATVLARYFDGKSAVQIAAETGVPSGTVRWRLKEAIERLRAALDERHGGDRRRWTLLVLPPARLRRWPALGAPAAVLGLAAVVVVSGARPATPARHASAPEGPVAARRSPPVRLAAAPEAPDGTGSVSGVVRDPSGRLIAGAAVVSFATRETTLATAPTETDRLTGWARTDAQGRFVLEGRLPGRYVVTVTHERFGPGQASVQVVARERREVDLRLSPGGERLSGTVRDTGAGPLAGAQVTVIEFPGSGPRRRFGTITGADGRYALRVPRGHWHVSALVDGYAYGWGEVVVEGPSALDLALPAAAAIAGRVVDGAGAPVPRALVRLDRGGGSFGRATTSGDAGYFSFGAGWPAGPYRVTATAGELIGRIEGTAPGDPARSSTEIVLRPGLVVAGRVSDPRGRPCDGVAVQLFDGPRQIQPVREVRTARDGRYRIGGLLPGPAWLAVEAPGRAPQRRAFDPLVVDTADFALIGEATLAGVLARGGVPVNRAELTLTLVPSEGGPLLAFRRLQTDARGAFRIDGLGAGTFLVEVQTRNEGAGRFQGSLLPAEQRRVTWGLAGPAVPDGRGREALVVGPF